MAPLRDDYFDASVDDGGANAWLSVILILAALAVCCCCFAASSADGDARSNFKPLKEEPLDANEKEKILAELSDYQRELEELRKAHRLVKRGPTGNFLWGGASLVMLIKLRANANRRQRGVLTVRLERATKLYSAPGKKTADAYAIIELAGECKTTGVIKGSLNPAWAQEVEFMGRLSDFVASGLRLRVCDSAAKGPGTVESFPLGLADVPLSTFAVMPGRNMRRACKLRPHGGMVHVSISWQFTSGAKVGRIEPAKLGPETWLLPQARGVLQIHLQNGHGLKAADANGKSDPYVILTCGGQKKTSKTIWKTLDPV